MRARAFCSLAVAASVGSLLAAGCGGGDRAAVKAAARCDARVGASSNANGVLWAQGGNKPAVYAVAGAKVIAPSGVSRVPPGATGVGFWSCRPYSLLYTSGGVLRMSGARGSTTIGANGVAAPNGWLLTFKGTTIRYPNGERLVARGVGHGWRITTVAVDPKNPRIVFASTESPTAEVEECKMGLGIAYRVTPATTSTVLRWTPCHGAPLVGWSPDGTQMSFIQGPRHILYVADPYGRAAVSLVRDVSTYLWSPDGSRIAYNVSNSRTPQVAVVDVATGATRIVAAGTLGAWSPDGKDVAVVSGSSLIGVPAAGGHPQKLASLS